MSRLTLVRHGQTEWSQNGRHTSVTDLALLPAGREQALALARSLDPAGFGLVLCSPRARAVETAALAGFGARAEICEDLVEWAYGDYEGLTTPEIRGLAPGWDLWRDGCPGGESPAEVTARVDRVIDRVNRVSERVDPVSEPVGAAGGEVILFAHGHILRALAARWLEAPVSFGERLVLSPAAVSRLAHVRGQRVLESWNAPAG